MGRMIRGLALNAVSLGHRRACGQCVGEKQQKKSLPKKFAPCSIRVFGRLRHRPCSTFTRVFCHVFLQFPPLRRSLSDCDPAAQRGLMRALVPAG